MNVLVFDGGNQNTLAIVRHLGRSNQQLKLHCICTNKLAIASYSRFCFKSHLLPSLKKNEGAFLPAVLRVIETEKIEYLLPVGSASFSFCIRNRDVLKNVKVLLPPAESFNIAESKQLTYQFASALGVPIPGTYYPKSKEELKHMQLSYPVVIKAPLEMGKNVVDYASNHESLIEKFEKMCAENGFKEPQLPLIQDYIEGDGYGYFAFYVNGECKTWFMHKRIREYPVTGGASTCAVSYVDPLLKQHGDKLLQNLKWHGPAMVEFKKDKHSGQYRLMEINPKFWGSLELSIVSGVNFPEYVLNYLAGIETEYTSGYKNIRFQWLLNGELLHFLRRPWTFFSILKDIFISKNDFYWRDIKPNLIQILLIPVRILKK
jgi:predicted ATP-grasp superfamily ATP-dependent carboligase